MAAAMPPRKRSASAFDGEREPATTSLPKHESPEEFSNAVKKKVFASSRTGQACDRCKIRKIRCDGLPGGCSPCNQVKTECRTTDRISGRATQRGYVENLEKQNVSLTQQVRELEQRLQQMGVDVKPEKGHHGSEVSQYDYSNSSSSPSRPGNTWSPTRQSLPPAAATTIQVAEDENRILPAFRAGCTGDNYLGVSPGNSALSFIKGTALSILGMEIDIADFDSIDMDEPRPSSLHQPLYNKSYQAFLQSALNINPRMESIELPPRREGSEYAQWYFRAIAPFMPLLHKPSFMRLLDRMYDDPSFHATAAETVMVHVVFAIMYFQYAARNWENKSEQARFTHQSNRHYHFALSKFYDLSCSHTFQDVQAMTLLCAHLRNFPKPGASWIMTQTAMALAIELGLHRSAKRWASDTIPNPLEVEMRKRTFWSLLAIDLTLSGKLGRPMTMRNEDFDVELPEPMDDELLSERGLDTSNGPGRCLHHIGLAVYSILPIYNELYCTIYAVQRKPENYVAQVHRLEGLMQAWQDGLSPEVVNGRCGQSEQEGQVHALYIQAWVLEFRLLLRHPAVSLSTDPKFNAASMSSSVKAARDMLKVVKQLQKLKSLDTTWYSSTVYVMAITTTLFNQWEKRGETSAADLAELKEEMDSWLDVMGDIGALLGSGDRLPEAVRQVTNGTLGLLARRPPGARPAASRPNITQQDLKVEPGTETSLVPLTNGNAYNQIAYPPNGASIDGHSASYVPNNPHVSNGHQQSYPPATPYGDYSANDNSYHQFQNYSTSTLETVEAPAITNYTSPDSQVSYNYPVVSRPQSQSMPLGPQAWQQWTNTVAMSFDAQNIYVPPSVALPMHSRHVSTAMPISTMTDTNSVTASVGMMNAHQGMMMVGPMNHVPVNINASWPQIFDESLYQQRPL
ncbi:hypothetical protein PVAG01_02074 [Phlyctema vagabunda]|uniref:Zn(2)-C6 fungal-type domain-containing protein n=1 Tax=Phlyctema vagabunda TaxID=108571 RepID=A0ABR4PPI2_9HELO